MSPSDPPARAWRLDPPALIIGERLRVSFQRTRQRPAPTPRSYGALPVALDTRRSAATDLLVPVASDEAFWVGLIALTDDDPVAVRIETFGDGESRDALTGGWRMNELARTPQNYLVCPPQFAIYGLQDGPACARQFARQAASSDAIACARLTFVIYAFTSPSGKPAASPADVSRNPADCPGVAQHIVQDPFGIDAWSGPAGRVSIAIVSPDEYSATTGQPPLPPLDDTHSYRGWRLP